MHEDYSSQGHEGDKVSQRKVGININDRLIIILRRVAGIADKPLRINIDCLCKEQFLLSVNFLNL